MKIVTIVLSILSGILGILGKIRPKKEPLMLPTVTYDKRKRELNSLRLGCSIEPCDDQESRERPGE